MQEVEGKGSENVHHNGTDAGLMLQCNVPSQMFTIPPPQSTTGPEVSTLIRNKATKKQTSTLTLQCQRQEKGGERTKL